MRNSKNGSDKRYGVMRIMATEILQTVHGETIGQKMEKITACMNTITFMAEKLRKDLSLGRVIVDSLEHDRVKKEIDEQYGRWIYCFEAAMETGVGDWIRGTELWDEFYESGERAHHSIVALINEEYGMREIVGVDKEK